MNGRGIYVDDSDTNALKIYGGAGKGVAADEVTITNTGSIGIGTTSPSVKLDVRSTSGGSVVDTLRLSNNSSDAGTGSRISFHTADAVFNAIDGVRVGGGSGGRLEFSTMGTGGSLTERMRIGSDGRLLINSIALLDYSTISYSGAVQIAQNGNAQLACAGFYDSSDYGGEIILSKSRSGTIGTNTIVENNDKLGTIFFAGANGTGYSFAAHIRCLVDGTPGASADMPGALSFATSLDGSATPAERARITSNGILNLRYSTWDGPFITSPTASGGTVSVASGGTINVTAGNAGAVLICVYDTNSGNGGVFFGTYTGIVTKIAGDGSATDAGSEIAVYKTASTHIITFKNRYGSTRDFSIAIYAASARE